MNLSHKITNTLLTLCITLIFCWISYNKFGKTEICIPVKSDLEAINSVKNEISLYLPSKKVRDILFNSENYININREENKKIGMFGNTNPTNPHIM